MVAETGMLYSSAFTHRGVLKKNESTSLGRLMGKAEKIAATHAFPWQEHNLAILLITQVQPIGGRSITGCARWTHNLGCKERQNWSCDLFWAIISDGRWFQHLLSTYSKHVQGKLFIKRWVKLQQQHFNSISPFFQYHRRCCYSFLDKTHLGICHLNTEAFWKSPWNTYPLDYLSLTA